MSIGGIGNILSIIGQGLGEYPTKGGAIRINM